MLDNSNYKLYYKRFIITDHIIYNNRSDTVIPDRTVKEAHLMM
jgi:hypothetical protein